MHDDELGPPVPGWPRVARRAGMLVVLLPGLVIVTLVGAARGILTYLALWAHIWDNHT